MRKAASLICLVVLLASSTDLHAQGQLSRITGTVTDQQGNPVEGAVLRAENPNNMPSVLEKTTDDEGRFAFGGLRVGTWRISVSADGFIAQGQVVNLGISQNLRIEILLEKAAGADLLATSSRAQEEIEEAGARFREGDYDGAIRLYEELLAKAPDVYQIHFNLALAHERKGDFGKAAEHYRLFIEKEPENFEAHFNLANALSRGGMNEESVAHYEKCTELRPDDPIAFYNLGLALFQTARLDRALEAFDSALAIDAELADAHFMKGNVFLQEGERDAARESFERFLELAPDSPNADVAREALKQLQQS